MATVSTSSTQITNRDASPRVMSPGRITRGSMLCSCGTLEATAADDIGSKYKLASIPSNAVVKQVLLSCDSLGTAGAVDIGIYQTTDNGGAVVDADFFASAQVLTSALANLDVTFEANGANASYDKAMVEKPLWQAMGLTADSKRDYDVVATVTAANISAGTISLQVLYAI